MRLKKGFTLAEILIVLVLIGFIATMTIPALMKGVQEAQYKTAYKKAYNTIVNLAAMERISGLLPARQGSTPASNWYKSLQNSLSVKEYVTVANSQGLGVAGDIIQPGEYTTEFTDPSTLAFATDIVADWIITEDGLAYNVITPSAADAECSDKATINGADGTAAALAASCVTVVVDTNGLSKGPNSFDAQITANNGTLTAGTKMNSLVGDRYYIFVGTDGATSGSRSTTVTGRIVNDEK